MKKVLILTLLLIGFAFSQFLQESFDGSLFPPEGWRVYNLEDTWNNIPHGEKSVWEQDGHGPHTTPGCAFCRKTYGQPPVHIPNNDWLVTPRVYPAEGASNLTFYYRGFTRNQRESLEVWVSRAGYTPADFQNLTSGYRVDAFGMRVWDYTFRTVSLASFINQPIYIAFRYCGTDPQRHGVFIDDVNTDNTYPPLPRIPLDVGVTEITRPEQIIAPTAFTPQATVKNYATNPASFETKCFIMNAAGTTTYYTKTVQVSNLDYNNTVGVTFPETTLSAGYYKIKFRTYLAGDQNTTNDEMVRDFQVLSPSYRDVGTVNIIKPFGEVMEVSLRPKAEIRNFGTSTEDIPVRIEIKNTNNGSLVYFDDTTLTVPSLVNAEIEFYKSWTPQAILYPYQVTVFTKMAGDANRSNDTQRINVSVPQFDAKVSTIYMPLYPVYEPTQVITPSAQISNRSFTLENVTVPSTFTITRKNNNSTIYTGTASTVLDFCGDATAEYENWTADTGHYVVKCITNLVGDGNHTNDSLYKDLFIPFRDVAPAEIEAPYDNFMLQPFIPRCIVDNNSNYYIHAPIELTISYNSVPILCDTNYVTIFEGVAGMVYFPMWTPPQIGTYTATFRAIFPYDLVPSNNVITKDFVVEAPFIDLAIMQIKAPKDSITPNSTIYPKVRVRNLGFIPVAGRIYSEIENIDTRTTLYIDSVEIGTPLIPGEERTVIFPQCTNVRDTGAYSITSEANITGDTVLENNTKTEVFIATQNLTRDVGVYSISEPRGSKPIGMITSQATVHNYGNSQENFQVQLKIYRKNQLLPVYAPIINVELNKQESQIIRFPDWASDLGRFVVRCTILLDADQMVVNNFKEDSVLIHQPIITGWFQLSDMQGSNKTIKEGGAATYVPAGEGKGIYTFVGNKTTTFLHYNLENNTWTQKASIPNGWGVVTKGAALCNDGSAKIYATIGNSNNGDGRDFLVYDIEQNIWLRLDPVPFVGRKPKKMGSGAGMAYIRQNGGYVYVVKGNNTNEFYAYSVQNNTWDTTLSFVDLGQSGKAKVKDGSSITTDGNYFIWLLKGKHSEFFCYDVQSDNWFERKYIPNKPEGYKAVSKGSAMAYFVYGPTGIPSIYTFKGGSFEFWRYNTIANTWHRNLSEYITPGNSNKKVGAGASLVYAEDQNTFYAFKGNNTKEFYKYIPNPNPTNEGDEIVSMTKPTTMLNNITTLTATYLKVHPKIVNNSARIFYQVNTLNPIKIKIYNNTGALIKLTENTLNNKTGIINLDLNDISAGIYFLRVESSDNNIIEKIVVQK